MKSFRAAAERIVRQEYSSASEPLRLLGAPEARPREVASDDDAWQMRLASLAAVGAYDGIVLIATAPTRFARSHNIADPLAAADAVSNMVHALRRYGTPMRVPATIALADGRMGASVLAAPLNGVDGVAGTLVAVRAGRAFDDADSRSVAGASALLAIELAQGGSDRQDARTRREALALFELARIGLARPPLEERLQSIVEMLAGTLGHDLAQLWLLRAGGSLRLRAAHPRESLVMEIARPRDNATLARALDGQVLVVDDMSLRAWVRRTTRGLIAASLHADGHTAGVLIFGRWREARAEDGLEMARLCGEFIARILMSGPHSGEAVTGETRAATAPENSRTGS